MQDTDKQRTHERSSSEDVTEELCRGVHITLKEGRWADQSSRPHHRPRSHAHVPVYHVTGAWSFSEHLQGTMKFLIRQSFQAVVLLRWLCPQLVCVHAHTHMTKLLQTTISNRLFKKKIHFPNRVLACGHFFLRVLVHLSLGAQGIQKRTSYPLHLELQVPVSFQM